MNTGFTEPHQSWEIRFSSRCNCIDTGRKKYHILKKRLHIVGKEIPGCAV